MSDVRALSVRQPWPWAIFHAGKDIENRDWPTRYRGLVLIHAGKAMTSDDFDDCLSTIEEIAPLDRDASLRRRARIVNGEAPRGGIVGEAEIVDCVTSSASPWFFGRYGFVLRNARPTPFRPCRGALGFFEPKFGEDA